jgi:transposase
MSDEPNYRALSAPEDKSRPEYSYVERRAELYDLVEQAGHYRNLERSQRDLARRYGVSQATIQKDLKRIREWKADRLGDHAEAELETLKTRAVEQLLDAGKPDKAYYLMMNHYETLMEAGVKQSAADEVQVDGNMSVVELLSAEDTDE